MGSSSHEQFAGKMRDSRFTSKVDIMKALPSDPQITMQQKGKEDFSSTEFIPSSTKRRRVRGKSNKVDDFQGSSSFESVHRQKYLKEKKKSSRASKGKKKPNGKRDSKVSTSNDSDNEDDNENSSAANHGDEEGSNETDTSETENNQGIANEPLGGDEEEDDVSSNPTKEEIIDIEKDEEIDIAETEEVNESSNTAEVNIDEGGKEAESNENYPIVSCGELPEARIKLELTYIYNFVASSDKDINLLIQFVEAQSLDKLAMEFVPCEPSRQLRRLLPSTVSVVGISASPPDAPSGSCGEDCTTVVGGMTLYLMKQPNQDDETTNHDTNLISCQILDRFQSVLLDFELLNANGNIHDLAFSETQDLGCEAYYDPNPSYRIQGIQSRDNTKVTHDVVISLASCISIFGLLGFILVRRHNYYRTVRDVPIVTVIDEDKEDRWSTVTPDTAGDSRQSPSKSSSSSPDRDKNCEARSTTLSPNSNDSRGKISEEIPSASFDSDMLDLSNKSQNNISTSEQQRIVTEKEAIMNTMGVGTRAIWTQILARLFNPNSKTFRTSTHENKDDFLFDEGEYHQNENIDTKQSRVVKQPTDMKPSPVMALWLESVSSDSSDGLSDGGNPNSKQQLHVIPEGDDEDDDMDRSEFGKATKLGECEDDTLSDATAEVSNVSPERRLRLLLEPTPNPRQRVKSPTYLLI